MFRALVFAFLVAAVASQHVAPCRCGAFITLDSVEKMLYELPAIEVHTCDQNHACSNRCFDEFHELSGGGDLNFITSDGVTTVGQLLCQEAGKAVNNEYVYAYSELCDGPWEWTGDQTMQPLCCSKDGVYSPCPEA